MSAKTKIEWTDATWNPLRGCSRVSEGCRNCYAERVAARFSGPGQPYEGLAQMIRHNHRGDLPTGEKGGRPSWTGKVELVEEHLADPLRWRKPLRIFVNSMSDLFHEKAEYKWIAAIFAVMALTPRHTYQILTKRPERMLRWVNAVGESPADNLVYLASQVEEGPWGEDFDCTLGNYINGWSGFREKADGNPMNGTLKRWPLPNVWLGVSVEDQKTADERIPLLLQTPAAVRWVSYEPALGPVNFRRIPRHHPLEMEGAYIDAMDGRTYLGNGEMNGFFCAGGLGWVVCGGESGPNARPMHPDWARGVRDQCQAAGVPFFFKQWGEWLPPEQDGAPFLSCQSLNCSNEFLRIGKKAAGRLLDGREWNEHPAVRP